MIDRTAYPDPNSYAAARRIVRDDIALRMMTALVATAWSESVDAAQIADYSYKLADAYLTKSDEENAK